MLNATLAYGTADRKLKIYIKIKVVSKANEKIKFS